MAFALSVLKIEEAMKKDGCPICRIGHEAAIHAVDTYLYEFVNDPEARKPINDSYGFCKEHTKMVVATELSTSGAMIGVNLIYSLLAKITSQQLKSEKPGNAGSSLRSFMSSLGISDGPDGKRVLEPKGRCPICEQVDTASINALSTIFDVLDQGEEEALEKYRSSSGLCIEHLRDGLEHFAGQHPQAAKRVVEDTVRRLQAHKAAMDEYLRKQNWAYRDEELTHEEANAWLKTLTFFTGYPANQFSVHIEKF